MEFNRTVTSKSPGRAAIYARLSVDRDGTKVGIDTQLEDSRKLAEQRGWTVTAEYVDRNLTAADKLVKRPEYDRMVSDFNIGLFANLVCWDLDRLTRQPRQLEDWIDAAEDRGLRIVTANGEADLGTDGGRMYARIKAAVAKGETERASARQRRNKQQRRESGLWHGGRVPYGYNVIDRSLVPYSPEVKMIQEAARRLLDDREPLNSICQDWNLKGKLSKNGTYWRSITLRKILLNRTLLGETSAGVVGWEPVIDQRTFDRVTALLMTPGRRKNHTDKVPGGRMAMAGGLTVCGRCGKPLTLVTKFLADGSKQERLACRKTAHGPDPVNHPREDRTRTVRGVERVETHEVGRVTIVHDALEAYVWGQLIAKLEATPRWYQRLGEADPVVNSRIDGLEHERSELREQRDRAGKAFVLGVMGEREAQVEVERIDAELDRIGTKISELLGAPLMFDAFKDGFDWHSWPPGKRRTALKGFIRRVVVNELPPGTGRVAPPFKGEAREVYEERRRAKVLETTAARVTVEWLWA